MSYLVVRTGGVDRVLSAQSISGLVGGSLRLRARSGRRPVHANRKPAAAQARSARPADHRRPRPQSRPRERRRARRRRRSTATLLLNVLGGRRRRARRRPPPGQRPRAAVTLRALLERIPPRVIPWHFVDLLETDPARRVKLKIAYEGLSKLHPADIADIVEDLRAGRARSGVRDARRRSRRRGAGRARSRRSRSRSSSRWTRIAPPTSSRRWTRMRPPTCSATAGGPVRRDSRGDAAGRAAAKSRQLLEFGEHTAAGRMTTEFIARAETAVVDDADRCAAAVRRRHGGAGDDLPDRRRGSSWAPCRWPRSRPRAGRPLSDADASRSSAARRTRPRTRSPSSSTNTTC